MAQITYADKVAINENPNVNAINKIRDEDMNEIKSVVNENATTLDNLNTQVSGMVSNSYSISPNNSYSCSYSNWKPVDNVTARTYINIPSGATEIKMVTYVSDTQYTVDLLVSRLSTTYKYIKLNGDTDYVHYEYNGTGIRCVQAYVGGQSNINNATTYMYYK